MTNRRLQRRFFRIYVIGIIMPTFPQALPRALAMAAVSVVSKPFPERATGPARDSAISAKKGFSRLSSAPHPPSAAAVIQPGM
jgi:hypothetical protein